MKAILSTLTLMNQTETHQLHLPENYVGSSNFTNTLLQSQLSVQPVKKNETLTQNFRETFVQFPEAEEDDYSLSHILAIGRDYCSKIKESSRNITGNKDTANSRVPLPYLNRSSTSQAIREQHHALIRKASLCRRLE
ncbi:Uncharacterized protein Fot_36358 [Forsythia ovata]|uniref:Uncharacterized protein n=1 Tax=Forsythia ovata TaxID=205694 RepID=A0ABD1SP57_9LAMI